SRSARRDRDGARHGMGPRSSQARARARLARARPGARAARGRRARAGGRLRADRADLRPARARPSGKRGRRRPPHRRARDRPGGAIEQTRNLEHRLFGGREAPRAPLRSGPRLVAWIDKLAVRERHVRQRALALIAVAGIAESLAEWQAWERAHAPLFARANEL